MQEYRKHAFFISGEFSTTKIKEQDAKYTKDQTATTNFEGHAIKLI